MQIGKMVTFGANLGKESPEVVFVGETAAKDAHDYALTKQMADPHEDGTRWDGPVAKRAAKGWFFIRDIEVNPKIDYTVG